jgi:hypothetical protein
MAGGNKENSYKTRRKVHFHLVFIFYNNECYLLTNNLRICETVIPLKKYYI